MTCILLEGGLEACTGGHTADVDAHALQLHHAARRKRHHARRRGVVLANLFLVINLYNATTWIQICTGRCMWVQIEAVGPFARVCLAARARCSVLVHAVNASKGQTRISLFCAVLNCVHIAILNCAQACAAATYLHCHAELGELQCR